MNRESNSVFSSYLGCLIPWISFGGAAAFVLLMVLMDYYDPVKDDSYPANLIPLFYCYLAAEIGISLIASVMVALHVHDNEPQAFALRVIKVMWIFQLVVWIVSCLMVVVLAA